MEELNQMQPAPEGVNVPDNENTTNQELQPTVEQAAPAASDNNTVTNTNPAPAEEPAKEPEAEATAENHPAEETTETPEAEPEVDYSTMNREELLAAFTSLLEEGQPKEMPVGVVDLDNTSTTRALIRTLDSFQSCEVVAHYATPAEAREAIENNKIAGLITDGDIRRAMEKWQAEFFNHTVEDIMTRTPKTVGPQAKISDIQKIMNKHKIHNVLVVDSDNHLMGIVDRYACVL